MMRRAELIAFLLAAGAAGVLVGALAVALGGARVGQSAAKPHTTTVYRASSPTQDTAPPDGAVLVEVLPGVVTAPDGRSEGLEAAMRLHLWLALRDIHPTGPTLHWTPARPAHPLHDPVDRLCLPPQIPARRTLGRVDPPLLGPGPRDRTTMRVFLSVSAEVGSSQIEAYVCAPGSRGTSQVFVADAGREGPALRELMAWLAGILRGPDVAPWFATWSRPVAPDVAVLRDYGAALAESMRTPGPPPRALLEAGSLLPEAAWVAGELSVEPLYRRRLFQRAAALQPGFTAALEDLAWEWAQTGRPDLALLALGRLRAPQRTRPSELLLAARLLAAGDAGGALLLLRQLPAPWTSTTAARRLEGLAALQLGDGEGARAAARAWTDAEPSSAEGWLLRGDAEQLLDERQSASAAYARALEQPTRLRARILERWAVLQLDLGRPAAVLEMLGDPDEALVPQSPSLLALRANAAWQGGEAARAATDTRRLVTLEPDRLEHRRNLCVFALSAGTTEAPPEECGTPVFPDLFGTLMEAVWLSRRPFRTPDEGGLLDRTVSAAAELAPLSPAAAGAALRVLGPRATKEELAMLQGSWQLARGTEPRAP